MAISSTYRTNYDDVIIMQINEYKGVLNTANKPKLDEEVI